MMAGEIILCQSRHTLGPRVESRTAGSLSHVSIGHTRMQGSAFYDR